MKSEITQFGFEVVPPKTRCKHGYYSCRACGTSDRTDGFHRTRGGLGVVGKVIVRSKSR